VRFEIFIVLKIQVEDFCVMTACRSVLTLHNVMTQKTLTRIYPLFYMSYHFYWSFCHYNWSIS